MMIRTENKKTFEIEYWYVDDDKDELISKFVAWEQHKAHAKGTFAEECYKVLSNPYKAELVERFGTEALKEAEAYLDD